MHQVDFSNQPTYGSAGLYGGNSGFNQLNISGNPTMLTTTTCMLTDSAPRSIGGGVDNFVGYSLASDQNSIDRELAEEVYEEETHTKAEIGAIEKGGYSDQKFEGCPDFRKGRFLESYTIHVYPVSAQLQEEKERTSKIEGAIYCSVCGRKQKSGQKFCPADGTEFGK